MGGSWWRRSLMAAALAVCRAPLPAQLPPATTSKIDGIATKALADSGTPSVSLAVVQGGKLAYVKAYGNARLEPPVAARPEMRYSIGSVSKQFLAGAILLLAQDGKLSLDDRVSRYLPDLTRASEVTIRQLLSHTSGYQDYYPQDYVAPFMQQPVTADAILDQWARKPLDFDPGARWQYSNTNYVAAGRIVERVTGGPVMAFLAAHVLKPLGISSAIDLADRALTAQDAAGYTRFAMGPMRPALPEGRGWLFAAGELAMTASDLAQWDLSLISHTLLKPASLDEMMTPVRLRNGAPTGYGLGVGVTADAGHPRLSHGGAVSGFVSQNVVWPDRAAAVVVLSNADGSTAPGAIAEQIGPLLVGEAEDPQAAGALEQARQIFDSLAGGKIERSLLTANADAYFTSQVLQDAAVSLKPLGTPESFRQTGVELRGGMTYRHFRIQFKGKSLKLSTLAMPDGKLEQYLIQ